MRELMLSNRQLASIGRNVNQTAKALNMGTENSQLINEQILNNIHNDINRRAMLPHEILGLLSP
ncbi:hypothetical protein BHECKSOX_2343 [Bathymodiolus heckerae thiotrophic gill symbiont]|nr:hypothetical protein BHECKSOX_2343 [Bathymodiolus heckerae thiotrophic gill symbiont]